MLSICRHSSKLCAQTALPSVKFGETSALQSVPKRRKGRGDGRVTTDRGSDLTGLGKVAGRERAHP